MAICKYRAHLIIYVLWHQDYYDGKYIADYLFSQLNRDINNPISRSLGIPVYFRNLDNPNTLPIDLNEAEHSAVVALIDDHMVTSPEWQQYLRELQQKIDTESAHRLYPVSITENAFLLSDSLSEVNFIRLHEIKYLCSAHLQTDTDADKCWNPICNLIKSWLPRKLTRNIRGASADNKCAFLLTRLSHELCRLLQNRPRISSTTHQHYSPAPVSMFISHAKADGLDIATRIKAYIDSNLPLKTFFDANDIAPGYSFADEIAAHGSDAALLVIKTDSYASREWCRKEVITAKEHDCPILVVNAVHQREIRSFPYLGNVPTIRIDWETTKNAPIDRECAIKNIIDAMLFEVLRATYMKGNYILNSLITV